MKYAIAGLAAASLIAAAAHAQVAGSTQIGIAAVELREVTTGWSARKQILGHTVTNELDQKIGNVDDIIVSPDKSVSYAIVGAGGFLGVAKHDVAIPVAQFKVAQGKLVLQGASRDAIKAMPPFEYAR